MKNSNHSSFVKRSLIFNIICCSFSSRSLPSFAIFWPIFWSISLPSFSIFWSTLPLKFTNFEFKSSIWFSNFLISSKYVSDCCRNSCWICWAFKFVLDLKYIYKNVKFVFVPLFFYRRKPENTQNFSSQCAGHNWWFRKNGS